MTITIPDEALSGAELKESELRLELAVALFQQEKLTLAQAARLAGLSRVQFQHVIAGRGLHIHFTLDDWRDEERSLEHSPRETLGGISAASGRFPRE